MSFKIPEIIRTRDVELTELNVIIRIRIMNIKEINEFNTWFKSNQEDITSLCAIINDHIIDVYYQGERVDDSVDFSNAHQSIIMDCVYAMMSPSEQELQEMQKKTQNIQKITRTK